jgi:arginine N-succinyltransferase
MFVVRPAEKTDIPALASLATLATQGAHTLPRTLPTIERRVDQSLISFAAQVDIPSDESYFFVLEDSSDKSIAGAAFVLATAGSNGTFFAFRNDVIQQVSRDLNLSHNVHVLTLNSDLSSYSQLSSFYLHNWRDAGGEAALLSRARLLFAAIAPHRFAEKFFVSLSGVTDGNGRSPFWEALGRKFFQMDYLDAERIIEGARNRTLLVELMPHYPVYVSLLPGDAQAVIGQVRAEAELPFRILLEDGFEPDEFVDIFDGGPILRAHKHALHSFAGSMQRQVAQIRLHDKDIPKDLYLIANTNEYNFRATIAACEHVEHSDSVMLTSEVMESLDVAPGDMVLCVRQ